MFLANSTRPDIAYATHQCARFSEEPKESHYKAVQYIIRYLHGSKHKGLQLTADPKAEQIDCWVDADFSGNYQREEAQDDADTSRSRTGYLIRYQGCPIIWISRMQTEIDLSTTEVEYVALSESLRDVLPFLSLLEEILHNIDQRLVKKAQFKCKLFEDNQGAVEMCRVPKMRPRTKHINVKYHHFRESVRQGKINIVPIETQNQLSDIFTKALDKLTFQGLRVKIYGW